VADGSHELESPSSPLTREDLLKRGAAAAFAVSMFGALPDKALGFYGPLKYAHKQLSGELRILQWIHFVPAYDTWLDNTYVKQWGEKNDVDVKIDHINNAFLFSTASSEVAAGSGHDLFQFLSPPSSFQKQVLPLNDIVQEVTRKLGPMTRVGLRSTYNPKTKKYFGFPDNYVPDPVHYRKSFLERAGGSLRTWEDVRKVAPKLKADGHPVGLGMSNELDSNMFLISLLYCYGGFIQNEENRIVLNSGSNRRGAIQALELMRDIYRNGMSDEVFAWNAASNNNAFVAGRLSMALNAISIARTAEGLGNASLSEDTYLASIPRGPHMRLGNEHVMGVYVIWNFAKNKQNAKRFLVDQQLGYRQHFVQSKFYNFPAWTGSINGGFQTIRRMAMADTNRPRGKYGILTTIAQNYTTNVGHPGFSNAVIDEIFNRYLIPQMFALVAQGKVSPADAVKGLDREAKKIYRKWRAQGLV
jgi:multiple sugar transport system substrate-binding protein